LVSQWEVVISRCDGNDTSFAACRPVLTRRYKATRLDPFASACVEFRKTCLVIASPTVCQSKKYTSKRQLRSCPVNLSTVQWASYFRALQIPRASSSFNSTPSKISSARTSFSEIGVLSGNSELTE